MSEHKLLTGPPFPFDVRTDYIKVTADTVLVPITLQIRNREMTFNTKDGVAKGVVNILGRVSTISRRPVQTFEDTVEVSVPVRVTNQDAGQPANLLEITAAASRYVPN